MSTKIFFFSHKDNSYQKTHMEDSKPQSTLGIKRLEKELIKLLEADLGDFDNDFFRVKSVAPKNAWNQLAQNPVVPQSVEYPVQSAELDIEKAKFLNEFFHSLFITKITKQIGCQNKTQHNLTWSFGKKQIYRTC